MRKKNATMIVILSIIIFTAYFLVWALEGDKNKVSLSLKEKSILEEVFGDQHEVLPMPLDEDENYIPSDFAQEVPVLVYHHLLEKKDLPSSPNESIIAVEDFRRQMELLNQHGFQTVSLDALKFFVKGEEPLPSKSVVITFDDGYKSNYIYAHPILKEYGFEATIFLITDYIADETLEFDPSQLQYFSWEEIHSSQDVFNFASHTHNLHLLDSNNEGYLISKPEDVVITDLVKSKELLNTTHLAYPYGHYDEKILDVLQKLGFTTAYTVIEGNVQVGDNLFELKRWGIYYSTSLEIFEEKLGLQ
ncbi:Polysaccharide deacetylase [Natronincola peptidivorans]|uniref:Polysaccharide deacetylase n=1 Tax=Natronincola peptidivorans TaxID=426128 RepID=A0A1I0E0R0_9FIRM|nr:polysaccharide deacetylase family protein [Natronincola peptidivorans]SET37737.1 Polysaccharide deacetylase [Natronincola peptidivorans]